MPARLVYSPKAYVYTKDQSGTIYNLTNYVTAGRIDRKINQISTAEITLRNPYKYFTGGMGQDRIFHPMDPITIYLERLQGFPVRVFTGYLDTTPYYQMYPGTVTLQASCTLKRLLYTYFDPSLPYVMSFFESYGWLPTGTGSILSASAFKLGNGKATGASLSDVEKGTKPFTNLQDGSLGKLLWAILYNIGDWQDSNIYIEDIPNGIDGIAARMQQLIKQAQIEQDQTANQISAFLENVIGTSSQGSGGGPGNSNNAGSASGPVKGGQQIVQTVEPIANQYNVPLEMVLAVMYIETGYSNQDTAGNPHYGWFQVQTAAPPYIYGTWANHIPSQKEAHDLGLSATAFCSAAAGWVSKDPSLRNDIQSWAEKTQGVTGQNNPYYVSGWPAATASAKKLISQFGQSAGNPIQSTANAITQVGNVAAAGTINVANIFPDGVTPERIDEGVDYTGAGKRICCIADSDIVSYTTGAYGPAPGNLMILRFKNAPLSQGGCSNGLWYVSEMFNPSKTSGSFKAGDVIGTIIGGSGIEVGWWDSGAGNSCGSPQVPLHDSGGPAVSAWGKDFSNLVVASGSQPGTITGPTAAPQGGTPINDWKNVLSGKANFVGPSAGGGTSGGSTGAATSQANAEAFVAELNFPTVEDMVTAVALGTEHKGLMHDQPLLPFVQQVAQASLRSFQSLPNGDFYAFYPDYFGEMGHHKPYWYIHDIEILDGGVNLSDDALATHVFAVGDNMLLNTSVVGGSANGNTEMLNMLFSSANINVFNAFVGNGIVDNTTPKDGKRSGTMQDMMSAQEASAFIQRYGARPLVQNYPMVRSSIFEMLLAYQQFMFAWSNQFKTPFTFTFMPEIFPGGKVGFPEHGLQMYVNSVTHQWDYAEGGFTTTAELSAPAILDGANPADFPDIPPHMVQAIIEPVRKGPVGSKGAGQSVKQATQQVANIVDQTAQETISLVDGVLGIGTTSNAGHGTVA